VKSEKVLSGLISESGVLTFINPAKGYLLATKSYTPIFKMLYMKSKNHVDLNHIHSLCIDK